jgi:hypothetical protein
MKQGSSGSVDEGTRSSENDVDLSLQGLTFQLYSFRKVLNKEFRVAYELVPQYLLTNVHYIMHYV